MNQGKLVTKEAMKTAQTPEVITLPEEGAEAPKTCQYCEYKAKGEVLMQRHQMSVHFKCPACNMVAISM